MASAHLLLLIILPFSLAYDPVANPKATVTFGKFRATVLTSTLVRMEFSPNATFDDRASLQVVHRHLPVPDFSVTKLNETAIRVTTSDLSLTYVDDKISKCATVYQETDVEVSWRSPNYPNGVAAATQDDCCAICTADPNCGTWVYDTSGKFCFPLLSFSSLRSNVKDRVVGTATLKVSINFRAVGADGQYIGPVTWTPSLVNTGNLNGTYWALDCYSTPMQCNEEFYERMQPGLLSTSGWQLLDDSYIGRFTPAARRPAGVPSWWSLDFLNQIDWYFQIHRPGADHFRNALSEWASVLGAPPMLPRQAFGVWWSRYYPYSQATFINEVLSGYANYSIPLSTMVLDVDWHNEPKDKGCSRGWGNYDVNETLWPDMTGFAQAAHEYGVVTGHPLRISFNIHADMGVDFCDKRYPAIALAMGVDPTTRQTIPCDFGNQTFTSALFSTYFDAEPLHLVDFWWTDYEGCGVAAGKPLLWNNYVMYDHAKYGRHLRGQGFSRYGGLGNHRYPHGFSGDTFQHEVVLYWQIKTTQTAANVLFGYWSHDIGGFHDGKGCPGDHDPKNVTGAELLLRWIQFGAVSPILRTHCDHCERRIWMFPYFESMRDAMRLRNALVPYIYTASRINYDTAVAAVHPLYYDFPADGNVYTPLVVEREYMFGDSILASPISSMSGQLNGLVNWTTYLPQSQMWVNWNGTHMYPGSQSVTSLYSAADIPLFVRAGAIIPMQTNFQYSDVNFPDPLVWSVWPGMSWGQTTLYEDVGSSDAYIGGQYVLTNASFSGDTSKSPAFVFTIAPATVPAALPDGFPATRSHTLHLLGFSFFWTSISSAQVNGSPILPGTGPRGYYIISAGDHSLTHPQGTLVVNTGPGLSTFAPIVISLIFN